jgi:hypothetical protein
MKKMQVSTEKGQVLVIIILALAGLMGFVALAIDGGMIYSDRRTAQNVADAAAYAGAAEIAKAVKLYSTSNFSCTAVASRPEWPQAYYNAVDRAADNDYVIEIGHDNNNGVLLTCADGSTDHVLVEVRITQQTQTNFMQMFYSGFARRSK